MTSSRSSSLTISFAPSKSHTPGTLGGFEITLYNVISKPPKVPGVCDLDGAKLIVREDDREEVIRERLEAYEKQTRPLLDYFREKGKRLYEVDASHDSPEQVFRNIEALIRKQ